MTYNYIRTALKVWDMVVSKEAPQEYLAQISLN